ncbi:uncharacterized protein Z519_07999 [Cladophialophora bantiana CBS 173.52]|uniref:Uncharacterized protein n=1 Tax=Cladophialophora bantiana (strain ATCC 10958 / CBS 173.52 / CDC B-1940 / NIH 8579) TaxID=1442370 RepID=A0A0D2HK44_CLAB1|nr:uncharacterized protein Z519_07999 [Cladophialophora bantiana CBS 173.52]KIW91105.1 hypothetical protein Z519_07999 [Cladophialophora bantiana CBS 173.52]
MPRLALYKALLRESTRVGAAIESPAVTKTLQSLIRFRFHRDRKLLSPSQIANGIKAGYGSLSLLRQCATKSGDALNKLSQTLEQVALQAESTSAYRAELASRWKPPPPDRHAHLENLRRVANKANHISTPESPRIFQHPRPISELKSGIRKVPNLILAQGVPLLKYPGPTPVLMNRVLKNKILWGVRKWAQHQDISEKIQLGEWEDEWDVILAREQGITESDDAANGNGQVGQWGEQAEKGGEKTSSVINMRFVNPKRYSIGNEKNNNQPPSRSLPPATRVSWTLALRQVDRQLEQAVHTRGRQYAELGDKYWQVVLKERELKERERREKKHARRMARKQATSIFGTEVRDGPVSSTSSGFI